MAPKERRKGKKEIHKNNIETLELYKKFIIVGSGVQVSHILISYFISSTFSGYNYIFLAFAVLVHLGCYTVLQKLAAPELGPSGELLEAGMDLSETYFSEYAIDCIILTAGVQILSAISNYMWLLWLVGPGYVGYKAWTSLLWPWITSGPSGEDQEDKSKRKHRQKVKRIH